MEKESIILIQEISNEDVELGGIICFKNKILNNTDKVIKNIIFENISTIALDKVYYEFKKSNDEISIEAHEGNVEIDYLNPGDELEIYIAATVSRHDNKKNFLTFSRLKYNILNGDINLLESNRNIVNITKDNESEKTIFISTDKSTVELFDTILLDINIINKKNKILQYAQIENLIPFGTELVKNSLKINSNSIDIDDDINVIKLGTLNELQRINIKLTLKVKTEVANLIEHKINLSYIEILGEKTNKILLESNIISINILRADIEVLQEDIKKTTYMVNEKIVFKMKIKNIGTVDLKNIKIICTDSKNFIIDSVINNIESISNYNIESRSDGIIINNLKCGQEIDFRYLSYFNKMGTYKKEDIKIKFCYFDINNFVKEKELLLENSTILKIQSGKLNINEYMIEKNNLFLGESTKLKISMMNDGNIKLENIHLKLNLQKGLKIIKDSIRINGSRESINNSSLYIGTLDIKEVKTLICDVQAFDIFNSEFTKSISIVKYEYIIDNRACSDIVSIALNNVFISGTKFDVEFANNTSNKVLGINDSLEECVRIKNRGNILAKNIYIKEQKNDFIQLDRNSIKINDEKYIDNDFTDSIFLKNLEPNKSIDLKYTINIKKILPDTDMLGYNLLMEYQNIINDVEQLALNKIELERTGLKIRDAIIKFESKTLSKTIAKVGDEVRVDLKITNIGNEKALETRLIEELPNAAKIYGVDINGTEKNNLENVIEIGIIEPKEEVYIKYRFNVCNTFQKYEFVKSNIYYKTMSNGSFGFKDKEDESEKLKLEKYIVDLDIKVKKAENNLLNGEETYYILVRNLGETDIKNINLELNVNTQMEYKILEKFNEFEDFAILKQNAEFEVMYKIKFKANRNFKEVQLEIVATGSYIYKNLEDKFIIKKKSDIFIVDINKINVTKEALGELYLKGENLEYILKIDNEGNNLAKRIIFEDTIFGYDIVEESLSINGRSADYTILKSVVIDEILPLESIFIRFSVRTDTLEENILKSKAKVLCDFCNSDGYDEYSEIFEDFNIYLKVINVEISNEVSNEKLLYKEIFYDNTLIQNIGEIDLYDIEIDDFISDDLKVLEYNVYLGGQRLNNFFKNQKIYIPQLQCKEICEIKRKVQYIGLYSNDNIEVFILMNAKYIDKKSRQKNVKLIGSKNVLEGVVNVSKKFKVENNIAITSEALKEINNINIKTKVLSAYIIDSFISSSAEGEKFTGKKLIVRGIIDIEIEYIAANLVENIHFQKEIKRFSTYINLPIEFEVDDVDIRVEANNIEFEKISDKLIWNEVILYFNIMA